MKRKSSIALLIFCILYIGSMSLLYFRYPVVIPVKSPINRTYTCVIIDAGHGGEDGGTVGISGALEKDLNLAVAKLVAKELDKKAYNVIMTRDGDYATYSENAKTLREKKVSDIHNRFNLIEQTENCIFVSIHMNYYGSESCKGAQVFYSGNNPESLELAESIQLELKNGVSNENNRLVKKSGSSIYILYHTDVPAVLIECGFLSNREEEALLRDKDYQEIIAKSITKGITNFLNK